MVLQQLNCVCVRCDSRCSSTSRQRSNQTDLACAPNAYSGIHNSCNTLFFGQWRLATLDVTFRAGPSNFGTLDGGLEGDPCYIATPRRQILAGLADLRHYRPCFDAGRPTLRHSSATQGQALRIYNFMSLSTRPYELCHACIQIPTRTVILCDATAEI